ncbi:hypothetical protein [Polyangium mundeleinium]|uniref:Uncharacterized protein n=1 Tax=Polyangium mundeleinium TaxID=2995306 RepID=A0ABT5F3N9_9BACT|nr:hypothetical protein [Polyangium mundeleinium]MDC0748712.1 hypothetical protein [Polyangium mundeleinium]
MATIKTLPETATTSTSEEHFRHTVVHVRRSPHTQHLIAEVEAFHPRIDAAIAEEKNLLEAEAEAAAAVQFADRDLDDSVDFVGANVDRSSLLGARLFGDLRPSELKRPTLGGQLDIMRTWPEALAEADKAVLRDHAPVVAARAAAGVAAATEKKAATQKLVDFRTIGSRVKLNQDFNKLRKSLFGKLGEIQHAHKLGAGWAESFFLQDTADEPSLAQLDKKIGAVEGELDALKKQREALAAQEARIAAERTKAVQRQKKAKLETLQKLKADLAAQEAALLSELSGADTDPIS